MDDGGEDPALVSAFTVESQRLELDFNFCPRLVKGKTAITIQPQSPKLREIQLSCRQLRPTRVRILNAGKWRDVGFDYHDQYDHLDLAPTMDIHQHHFLRNRLAGHEMGLVEELKITLPSGMAVEERREGTALVCKPLVVEIEYILNNFRDGLHFVGVDENDGRYPHVYTRNTLVPGFASCLFPCVDDGSTRIPFELSVRYPRTVGDALCKSTVADRGSQANGTAKADSVVNGSDDDRELSEEERGLEMRAVCSGELTDTIVDPNDPSRTTSSFKIDPITGGGILPHHIGITIGPFQEVDLSEYRDESEGDRLQDQAVRVHAFCLPGKEDELRNSAMMVPRTLDSFVDCYQTFRLGKSYELVFVDDLTWDTSHTMALTICSSRLLYPENIWEPLEHTTRTLVHAVASQWIGVDVIAQEPRDHWIIVGASWFMTEFHLRDLFGRNDHRFRQKMAMDTILQLDVRRPSLHELGRYIHLDPSAQEFMDIKALAVLHILHNRLVKASGKNGVDRCLYRLLFNRAGGMLNNGAISTDAFLSICEKVGHQKLDNFFKQWVFGSGYPTFECQPVFNKKKQVVVLTIRQTQGLSEQDIPLKSSDFMRESKERSRTFVPNSDWPAFVGPMTIRIHEADGTPYEHIVEINSSNVRVEIPYNTKYKRIKRNKLNKERQALAHGVDASGEMPDEATIYSLGDLFLTSEEAEEWKIEDWPQEDELSMESEAYEYIRIDADFEWIARTTINDMRSYMFVSQLQQDKDVVAQAESIQYLARKAGHGIISSFLVKTLMDSRYFHGIRTMAASVLSKQTVDSGPTPMVGLFHLKKAFRELFYVPNSDMTRPNNFSDRASYYVQCAIPQAIAKVKNRDGTTPLEVKQFLLDIIRHNDNRGNEYSDDYYLAVLMRGLTDCLVDSKVENTSSMNFMAEADEYEFRKKAIGELDRHKRLDEWIPSYNNIYTTTALDCDVRLMTNRLKPIKISEFLLYSKAGNAENVRLKAWDCLVRLGMFGKKDSVTRFIMHELCADPSPYFKAQLLRIIGAALGQIAVGDAVIFEDLKKGATGGLEIRDDDAEAAMRKDKMDRLKLEGALRALKKDLADNQVIKQSLEECLKAGSAPLQIISEFLDICAMFVEEINRHVVVLKYPRYWKVARADSHATKNGKPSLRVRFYRGDRIRTKMLKPPRQILPPPVVEAPVPKPAPKIALKIKTSADSLPTDELPKGLSASFPAPTPVQTEKPKIGSDARRRSLTENQLAAPSKPPTPQATVSSSLATPAQAQKPRPSPTPTPTPTPTLARSEELPMLMEDVQMTSTPTALPPPAAIPSPAPAPSPAPVARPVVAPPAATVPVTMPTSLEAPKAPKLKIKTKLSKPPKALGTPKPPAGPRPKSKVVVLKLAPEKLSTLGKRKANTDIDGRPLKRQSTEPTLTNGYTSGHKVSKRGLVTVEKIKGLKPRLMVKIALGRGKLPIK